MAIVAIIAIKVRPTIVSHHQLLPMNESSLLPPIGSAAMVVVVTGAAVVVVVVVVSGGAVVVGAAVVVVVDVVVEVVDVVVVSGGNVVVVVVVVVVVGARVVVVVGARVVVVVVVVEVVDVVVGTMVTLIEHEPPLPSLAFSRTVTEPDPVAVAPTLIDTVADQLPASAMPPPPETMLALATPELDTMDGNAPLLETKLTVAEPLPPCEIDAPPHEAVASAMVADPSTNPTVLRSRKNAITIG